jgi:argininosuccinate lyase
VQLRPEKMAKQLEPTLLATDLADYLVKRGMPFRQAHHLVGEVVQLAENRGVALTALTLAELQSVSGAFEEGATAVFNITSSLRSRAVTGGTAPEALQAQLDAAKSALRA